jgi:CubicO group peptidase (beta-lactamase class C family)
MEADGYWALEADGGQELGGFGVSARLRDFGRFGQLVLEDGETFSGRRVLPPGWRDLAGQPDSAPTGFGAAESVPERTRQGTRLFRRNGQQTDQSSSCCGIRWTAW